MQIAKSLQLLPLHTKWTKPSLYMLSSLTETPTQTSNTLLFDYLIQTLNLSVTEAQSISSSTRYSNIKSLENPHSVLHYLRSLGFSESEIRVSVRCNPRILFSNVEKTLEPKIQFLKEMGVVCPHLGKLISNNSHILQCSLQNTLIPCTQILKEKLVDDKNNESLIRVLMRCSRLITTNPEMKLLNNIRFLESCGIVGSQLSLLLKGKPRIFNMEKTKLRDLVWRVLDKGFSVHSRMFVYALCSVSGMSEKTIERKLGLCRSFGYTEGEAVEMFLKQPLAFSISEVLLKSRLDFFLNKIEVEKEELIRDPNSLRYDIGKRVIPRYKVMQILKSKRLLKKEPRFVNVLKVSEVKFAKRFVARFTDDAEELLVAYEGHLLDSPSTKEEEESCCQ